MQKNAALTWDADDDFRELVRNDSIVRERLDSEELDKIFDYGYYVRFVDDVFERVGLS